MTSLRRRRATNLKDYLDEVLGVDGRVAVDDLLAIARGEMEIEEHIPVAGLTGAYSVRKVKATLKERAEILFRLLEHQNGKPRQSLDVRKTSVRVRFDPDKWSLEDLDKLEQLAEKAALPELPEGEVVDVEPREEETKPTKEAIMAVLATEEDEEGDE